MLYAYSNDHYSANLIVLLQLWISWILLKVWPNPIAACWIYLEVSNQIENIWNTAGENSTETTGTQQLRTNGTTVYTTLNNSIPPQWFEISWLWSKRLPQEFNWNLSILLPVNHFQGPLWTLPSKEGQFYLLLQMEENMESWLHLPLPRRSIIEFTGSLAFLLLPFGLSSLPELAVNFKWSGTLVKVEQSCKRRRR